MGYEWHHGYFMVIDVDKWVMMCLFAGTRMR